MVNRLVVSQLVASQLVASQLVASQLVVTQLAVSRVAVSRMMAIDCHGAIARRMLRRLAPGLARHRAPRPNRRRCLPAPKSSALHLSGRSHRPRTTPVARVGTLTERFWPLLAPFGLLGLPSLLSLAAVATLLLTLKQAQQLVAGQPPCEIEGDIVD